MIRYLGDTEVIQTYEGRGTMRTLIVGCEIIGAFA